MAGRTLTTRRAFRMSLNSEPQPGLAAPEVQSSESRPEEVPSARKGTSPGWPRRLVRLCLALFTFEVGLFLVIFPWTDSWHLNYFQELIPGLQDLWEEPSFRGALTGLGFVNIYIACLQVLFSFRRDN